MQIYMEQSAWYSNKTVGGGEIALSFYQANVVTLLLSSPTLWSAIR